MSPSHTTPRPTSRPAAARARWEPVRLSRWHPLLVDRTPALDFAERVRRLRYFSYVRVEREAWQADGGAPALLRKLRGLPLRDPNLFVGLDLHPGSDPAGRRREEALLAAVERTLPPGYRAEDGAIWRRATVDGTLRALYQALRPLHVVALGPPWLIELAGRLRLSRFTLKPWTEDGPGSLAPLAEEHRRYRGEPVAYLLRGGAAVAAWALESHGGLHNAFVIDLGSALEACVPERVRRGSWGAIHWRAVARHLGLDPGPREAEGEDATPPATGGFTGPHPGDAPGRPRPPRRTPAVERRRGGPRARADEAETGERLREGDLERCLQDALLGPSRAAPGR